MIKKEAKKKRIKVIDIKLSKNKNQDILGMPHKKD
jgi:hypothetical protein